MAKTGFIYYSVVTNRYEDKKIKKLKKDMGCAGLCVYDKILCEIYREEGCFIMWDEDTAFDVADYFGLKETLVNEIVAYCCNVGLFNKELYAREKVLSSLSIQSRFLEWSKIAKRKNIKVPEKYVILPEKTGKLPEEIPKIPEDLDKVKESKVKESKEEDPRVTVLKSSNLFREPVIPSKNEVLESFIQNGGTKEMAKAFWERNESTGWFFKGSPITNFRTMVYSFVSNWKQNELNKKPAQFEKSVPLKIVNL